MNELCRKGAHELAELLACGEVTSAEVVEAHLARIEEVSSDVNAATETPAEQARASAAADEARATGVKLGPLAG